MNFDDFVIATWEDIKPGAKLIFSINAIEKKDIEKEICVVDEQYEEKVWKLEENLSNFLYVYKREVDRFSWSIYKPNKKNQLREYSKLVYFE